MSGKFLDTNILIYAITENDPRAEKARALLAEGGRLSIQVLNEFVAVARRKFYMQWSEILEALAAFQAVCPNPISLTHLTHKAALGIAERYGYRIYDSLIVAAALESNCDILYSEDLKNGQLIEGLQIRNPFQ